MMIIFEVWTIRNIMKRKRNNMKWYQLIEQKTNMHCLSNTYLLVPTFMVQVIYAWIKLTMICNIYVAIYTYICIYINIPIYVYTYIFQVFTIVKQLPFALCESNLFTFIWECCQTYKSCYLFAMYNKTLKYT